ncbi:DUF6541 family protein [Microbacterium sp.]|uniref:DUF6541 family protein n=1 Tax=Microbacterium sp. TaxID=51671 RepID=UPI0028124B42|nr:DUF6541 family protein [Microbacterium sp.]
MTVWDWLAMLPVMVVAIAVVLLPGLLIGAALRVRGVLLWGFAPAAGVAALAVSAGGLGILGVGWSVWTAGIAVLLLAGMAALIGHSLAPAKLEVVRPGHGVAVAAAVAAGALLGMVRMASLIRSPDSVSQTNDATFHLNALRFISDSGSASSLDLLGAIDTSGFYPAAWHAVASTVAALTGADVVRVANATSLAIAGPIWVLSITSFVWCTARGARAATIAAALMSPALLAFPFYALDFGVLYPYALSVAVLPGVLAVLVALAASHRDGGAGTETVRRRWLAIVASAVGLAAIALAQPAALLIWVIGAVSLVLWIVHKEWAGSGRRRRIWLLVTAFAVVVAAALVWAVLMRFSPSVLWSSRKSLIPAVVDLVLNDSIGPGPAVTMSALAIAGIVVVVCRRPLRWLLLYGAAISVLTLVAVSVRNEAIRGLLSAWYADPHRFIMMMPLVVIPLAAIGVAGILRLIGRRSRTASLVVGAVVAGVLLVETTVWAVIDARSERSDYGVTATSYLSIDERLLLERLPHYVDRDDRVLGDPSAGAAFGYALSGVDVVPRTWSMPNDAAHTVLGEELVDLADEPAVCEALASTGIDYVLDFGQSTAGAGRQDMPGLTGFADAAGFRKVAQQGDASLWRITGCD